MSDNSTMKPQDLADAAAVAFLALCPPYDLHAVTVVPVGDSGEFSADPVFVGAASPSGHNVARIKRELVAKHRMDISGPKPHSATSMASRRKKT